jgi:hypothetical protein
LPVNLDHQPFYLKSFVTVIMQFQVLIVVDYQVAFGLDY